MRVRIVRMFCQVKYRDVLVVQRWMTTKKINQRIGADPLPVFDECWDPVKDFELDEYGKATAYAMDLSLEKRSPTELAVFQDGECVKEQSVATSGSPRVDCTHTQ